MDVQKELTKRYPFKRCKCSVKENWEEIISQRDNHYESKNVIYYHCAECGTDWAVLDLETNEILYLQKKQQA